MADHNQTELSQFERNLLEIFGRYYEKRGMPNALGQIYILLAYKAPNPEAGLDQQYIANIIDRSVSTASRLLNKLVQMGFADYTEEINENDRRERKYYMLADLQEMAANRFQLLILENKGLHRQVKRLEKKAAKANGQKNKELINYLDVLEAQIGKMSQLYEKLLELSEDILD